MSVNQINLLRHLRSIRRRGFGYRLFRPKHTANASELAMQAHIVGCRAKFGLINDYSYAYVVLLDGTLVNGLFHQLSDSFSLS